MFIFNLYVQLSRREEGEGGSEGWREGEDGEGEGEASLGFVPHHHHHMMADTG